MAVKIEAVEITPNKVNVKAAVSIKVTASMVTWQDLRDNHANWSAVKTKLTSWKAVNEYTT